MCLAEKYKVVPQVIKFNVMKPGEVIHYMPTQARPLIVLLDELPHVMEIVEAKKNTATESLSYPCMLGLLDYWGMQKHVVVIGTANMVSLENNELFRRGRFNNVQYFNAYYMSHRP
jgi:SpoVK/Ycf46/Vps4 family AAA+-type ATPase